MNDKFVNMAAGSEADLVQELADLKIDDSSSKDDELDLLK